ncbi:aminoglycoside adenylyltransferase domain-containing protein [Xenorhabdus sp. PB62.4]|uniref:aminoglycoside adenylyltransferase domain-containing protein n=1 Tax=Xenorhabdus sp. PB62.4 TaxID=1851573 RepID=UPI0016571DD7|nr:aminoglycoside adenylyltransferase domain-containing protein [Xenorhabdus sp. PB62.4]MBC8953601.1 hypothetical protein [Xenorhabdus sp. PB62.4]
MYIPSEADKALLIIQKRLAESLVAIYLHGSAVVGGLRPLSDVDLLVVIDQPMTSEVRECLTADLMRISGRYPSRQEAISLVGPNASSLLPTISRSDIRRAIKDVLPDLIGTLQGDERNVLLTLARMWRTLVTGEFVSKDAAADWAAARLPAIQATVLADARETYLRGCEEDWRNRQQELQITVSSLHDCVLMNL